MEVVVKDSKEEDSARKGDSIGKTDSIGCIRENQVSPGGLRESSKGG